MFVVPRFSLWSLKCKIIVGLDKLYHCSAHGFPHSLLLYSLLLGHFQCWEVRVPCNIWVSCARHYSRAPVNISALDSLVSVALNGTGLVFIHGLKKSNCSRQLMLLVGSHFWRKCLLICLSIIIISIYLFT